MDMLTGSTKHHSLFFRTHHHSFGLLQLSASRTLLWPTTLASFFSWRTEPSRKVPNTVRKSVPRRLPSDAQGKLTGKVHLPWRKTVTDWSLTVLLFCHGNLPRRWETVSTNTNLSRRLKSVGKNANPSRRLPTVRINSGTFPSVTNRQGKLSLYFHKPTFNHSNPWFTTHLIMHPHMH